MEWERLSRCQSKYTTNVEVSMADEKPYLVSVGKVLLFSDGHTETAIHYYDEKGMLLQTPEKTISTEAAGAVVAELQQGRAV
jgi:hypothetical protein